MPELLDFVLDAHGGLNNWKKTTQVEIRMNLGGYLLELKGFPDGLKSALMKIDTQRPRNLIVPFPRHGTRGLFEPGRVSLIADNGDEVSDLENPRSRYEGHTRTTPWNDHQYLYFIGYAFWNYMTTPFLLAMDGVTTEELEPWQEHGAIWRVLEATFDPSIDTHTEKQRFYFDDKGMLVRHDYFTDVAKGTAAHYCFDPRPFDGFVFPTRHRVVTRDENRQSKLTGPSSVWVELESVVVT